MAPKNNRNDAEKKPLTLKLLVIGDSGVGKSNIINVYVGEPFQSSFITTIGVDFKTKLMKKTPPAGSSANPADGTGADIDVKLNIWDTAGQERFRTITTTYYRGTNGILVAFDLCNKQSFLAIQRWLNEMEQNCTGSTQTPPAIILGNKCDISKEKWEVSDEDIGNLKKMYSHPYYLTSALTGENLETAFSHLTDLILARRAKEMDNRQKEPFSTIDINNKANSKNKKKNRSSTNPRCLIL